MSIESSVNSRYRKPCAKAFLAGLPCRIPNRSGAININQVFGQSIAGGTIALDTPPKTPMDKDPLVITWGYNEEYMYAIVGFVTNPQHTSYPDQWSVQVQDMMFIADYEVKGDDGIVLLNYVTGLPNAILANEAIERLLRDWAGIPDSRMNIPTLTTAPGEPWILGQLTPVQWTGATPLQAALSICTVLGYWLFSDASGVVRAVRMSGAPTARPFVTFEEGVNLLITGPPSSNSDITQIYDQITVTGANTGFEGVPIKESRQSTSTILPDGKHREFSYSNPLIEYENPEQSGDASAVSVAERMLKEHDRIPNTITAKIKGDPRLQVGMTVAIKSKRLGYRQPKLFFIYGINATFGGGDFSMSLTLDGGVGADGYTLIPNPLASFAFMLHKETWDDGIEYIEVFLDGTTSTSLGGGEIIGWEWSDNYVPPNSATGPKAMFKYPATVLTIDITLIVTDVTSKISSVTQTVDLTGALTGPPTKREISFAADTAWYVTPNGGKTWLKESTGIARAVPPISGAGSDQTDVAAAKLIGLIATSGVAGASLRETPDYLKTPSTPLLTTTEPINFVWQHEKIPARIWYAHGTHVSLSVDGGLTTIKTRTPGPFAEIDDHFDCVWVVEAADTPGLIDVVAGRDVFTSWDEGDHWTLVLEGPSGSEALCYASGFARHWVGYDDPMAGSIPLRSIEGDIAAFIDADPEPQKIPALTILVDRPVMYAFDEHGRIWRGDVDSGNNMVVVGTMPEDAGDVHHANRDGIYPIIYVSCTNGLYKVFVDTEPVVIGLFKAVDPLTFERGLMSAYAGLAGKGPVTAALLIPTYGDDPGGVWYGISDPTLMQLFEGDVFEIDWVLANGRLPYGLGTAPLVYGIWSKVTASPINPNVWVVQTAYACTATGESGTIEPTTPGKSSPFWITRDAGKTWHPLTLPVPPGVGGGNFGWSADFLSNGKFAVLGGIENQGIYLWRGDEVTGMVPTTRITAGSGSTRIALGTLIPARDGDVIMCVQADRYFLDTYNYVVYMKWNEDITHSLGGGDVRDTAEGSFHYGWLGVHGDMVAFGANKSMAFVIHGNDGRIYAHPDYTNATVQVEASTDVVTGTLDISSAINTVYMSRGLGTIMVAGIWKVQYAGSPGAGYVEQDIDVPDEGFRAVRVDRQTRTVVATRRVGGPDGTHKQCYVYDGSQWILIEGPASAVLLADTVEPLAQQLEA